ncbi:MAG: Mini-ribonuclease 3-like protein [Fusobacterium sp.]|nr:Mini-ribonuclease 3-like protein [Fusobacterium sp.]
MKSINLKKRDIREFSGIELAYLGDAIWELEVRKYYLQFSYNILKLNRIVKSKVNAKAQSIFLKKILPVLDDEQKAIAKRAKNSNIKSFPKSCTVIEYREATAFEAVIGALYLSNKKDKLNEIKKLLIEGDGDGTV